MKSFQNFLKPPALPGVLTYAVRQYNKGVADYWKKGEFIVS